MALVGDVHGGEAGSASGRGAPWRGIRAAVADAHRRYPHLGPVLANPRIDFVCKIVLGLPHGSRPWQSRWVTILG